MIHDILTTIIANKRKELEAQMEAVPLSQLETRLDESKPCISMSQALVQSATGIIAEFKRRSPSKGWIHRNAKAETIVNGYVRAGAAALSILTDDTFFGGTLNDIRTVRSLVHLPILRKDFVISPYQLYQAKMVGADAVLLIATALSSVECRKLSKLAHELHLEVLLELHNEKELDCLNEYVDMIGVNNRHLGTFHTDVEHSFRMAECLPKDKVLVSESGLSSPETVRQLRTVGYRGFLIGELFMKSPMPEDTLSHFIQQL